MTDKPLPPMPPLSTLGAAPSLAIVSQYVKDLSFETPMAPSLPQVNSQPRFEVSVNASAKRRDETLFAAEQTIGVKAEVDGKVLFNLELVYGGVFRLQNVPADKLVQVLMVDCQQLLFPFARQVVTTTIANGGFPPLMLQPVDFVALFRKNQIAKTGLPDLDRPVGKPN